MSFLGPFRGNLSRICVFPPKTAHRVPSKIIIRNGARDLNSLNPSSGPRAYSVRVQVEQSKYVQENELLNRYHQLHICNSQSLLLTDTRTSPMGARFSRPDSKRRSSSSSRSQNASSPSLPQPTPVQMKQLQDGEFVGSLDCGTTSVRFIVFDSSARIVAQHQLEFPQYYPNPGWHEHDADEIQAVSEKCIEEACKQLEENGWTKRSVKAIGESVFFSLLHLLRLFIDM